MASSDFKPPNQHLEVQKILADELRTHLQAPDGLMAKTWWR